MSQIAAIYTLGCRLNSADSALLTNRLKNAGIELVQGGEDVDIIIVNTCCVTAEAARKSRQTVRQLRKKHPESLIIVCGCGATKESYEGCGANLFLDNHGKKDLIESIRTMRPAQPEAQTKVFTENALSDFPFLSRAFIKIQEGCNNFCTYCIVPYTRGRERSRAAQEVLSDCQRALKNGFPELILTGVNTCAYGDGETNLARLITQIAAFPGDFRIRLSSTEPHPDNLNLLEIMANPANRVCRFLHLSLQHGSDRILRKMNRHYTSKDYINFVTRARDLMPDIHLGTDIIVGFPGETDEDFATSCNLVKSIGFANIHLFTYSKRSGTPAADMPNQIEPELKKSRYNTLKSIAEQAQKEFASRFVGKKLQVIFEEIKPDGLLHGWSDNYLAVRAPAGAFSIGKIVEVEITGTRAAGELEAF